MTDTDPQGSRQAGLVELLARVESATGPDRELNCLLASAIDPELEDYEPSERFPGCLQRNGIPGWTTGAPLYTHSLDAALALVERVLPGSVPPPRQDMPLWLPRVARWFNGKWEATLYRSTDGYTAEGRGPTPALALLAALLKALIADADQAALALTDPTGRDAPRPSGYVMPPIPNTPQPKDS